MPFHHLALAVRDMPAVDAFYTHAMGFELVKVEVAKTPDGGWAKHFFYDTGDGELMAFWELHDESLPSEFPTSISAAAGLPPWTNHLAFRAASREELARFRERWLEHGYDVMEIDHRWCHSIYTTDPGGMLVEFCVTTAAFGEADRERARRAVTSDDLELDPEPEVKIHRSPGKPLHRRLSPAA